MAAESTSVSPPPVYYSYSLKAEKGTDGYRLSAHVYANKREDAVEMLTMTILEAEKSLESKGIPVSRRIKE